MIVSILMGSKSDWPIMEHAANLLDELGIRNEARVLSAHRMPVALTDYIHSAEKNGTQVFIAGAGGAAHLPGVIAAQTILPVIGVPIQLPVLDGLDSLLSIVQMPGGVPVATMAIGKPGAINAALFAASLFAITEPRYATAIKQYRQRQVDKLTAQSDPRIA